jgi:DNA polymerase-3 subunit delta
LKSFDPDGQNTTVLAMDDVAADPGLLENGLASTSLFGGGGNPVVLVKNGKDSLKKLIEPLEHYLGSGVTLIIEAGDLSPRSSLRKWAEGHDNIAAIPCYEENESALAQRIVAVFQENGLQISPDTTRYLLSLTGTERHVIDPTLEKIITYCIDKDNVVENDITACCTDMAEAQFDALNMAILSHNFASADRLYQGFQAQSVSNIALLRSWQIMLKRLIEAKSTMGSGQSADMAMKSLRPPVFFKQQDQFRRFLHSWSMPKLNRALELALQAEAQSKTGLDDTIIMTGLIRRIAGIK